MIGTKWVFRNKHNQDGIVVRNKARLVTQGYTQVDGLDFGETYALVHYTTTPRLAMDDLTLKAATATDSLTLKSYSDRLLQTL